MSKAILNTIGKVAGVGHAESVRNISDEQPTVPGLVLSGAVYKASDEFACLLKLLGGESA